jgi:hypothetical protein
MTGEISYESAEKFNNDIYDNDFELLVWNNYEFWIHEILQFNGDGVEFLIELLKYWKENKDNKKILSDFKKVINNQNKFKFTYIDLFDNTYYIEKTFLEELLFNKFINKDSIYELLKLLIEFGLDLNFDLKLLIDKEFNHLNNIINIIN